MDSKNATLCIRMAAEMQSMSRAAAALNVSQPAISAQIKRVESYYHIEIFDRAAKPLTLTEEGRAYLQFCSQEEKLEREFRRFISNLTSLRTGELTIGGPTLFNSIYLPETVARFNHVYPGVSLRIVDRPVPELMKLALTGELDFFFAPAKPENTELVSRQIKENRLLLVVPASYPVNEQLKEKQLSEEDIRLQRYEGKEAELSKFDRYPFILLNEDQNVGMLLRRLLRESKVTPSSEIIADQILTSYALSGAGAGISLASSPIVEAFGGHNRCFYTVGGEACRRRLFVCWKSQRALGAAGTVFLSMLEDTAEKKEEQSS